MSAPAKDQFDIGKILGYLFALLIFALLAGIGLRLIPKNPKVGWFSLVLFGTMCVLTVVEIVRICGLDQDQVPEVRSQLNLQRLVLPVGSIIVTLFLGLADNFISFAFTNSFPRPGVWFGTFVTTLALYPLREQEQKDLNFKFWIIFCALMGVASVIVSYVKDWLENVLT